MEIKLYNNQSEHTVINKSLGNAISYVGSLRDISDISNPSIMIQSNGNVYQYNYCYIPEFSRYYFITEITTVRTGVWVLSMKCDVLMSFKNDILNCYAIINHTTDTNITRYMDSDIFRSLVKDFTDILNFPSGLSDNGEYILITAGGD